MKKLSDLINESGAGLWGTDKARERLQKDTPGQEIKSLVKKSEKVSEVADPKGTIKVVKQDKVRYITKDELNTYRQMGWKQVEKRPQGYDKIRAARKAHAAGTWDGNVNKDGKPIVHIDGKPVVVEGYDRAAVTAAVKKAAEKENMKSKRDVERFFDYDGGDIIFRMVKDEDEANVLMSQLKSQYKQKFKEDADVTEISDKLKKKVDRKRKWAVVGQAFRGDEKHPDYQKAVAKQKRTAQLVKNKTRMVHPDKSKAVYATSDQINHYRSLGYRPEPLRKESVEQLNEIKVSFKFDKLADAAKAERKANQMKKLDVNSEKVQGKMIWLLHVTGNFTDIMKYIRRVDLEDKVHESKEFIEATLAARDSAIVDSLLKLIGQKLNDDLSKGKMKDVNKIAKMVRKKIEQDTKRKGHSRMKQEAVSDEPITAQDIKMAIGIANDARYKGGNYTAAYNKIAKMKKGLVSHPRVKDALRQANESLLSRLAVGIRGATNGSKNSGTSKPVPKPKVRPQPKPRTRQANESLLGRLISGSGAASANKPNTSKPVPKPKVRPQPKPRTEEVDINEGMLDTLKQRVQQAKDALQKFRDSETAKRVRDQQRARIERGRKILDAPNLRKRLGRDESIEEGSESWEDGYKRRVVRTTKPEHKEKGYNWRIKGKDKAHLTIKLYKDKPSLDEFKKQMKRVAGHEFGG